MFRCPELCALITSQDRREPSTKMFRPHITSRPSARGRLPLRQYAALVVIVVAAIAGRGHCDKQFPPAVVAEGVAALREHPELHRLALQSYSLLDSTDQWQPSGSSALNSASDMASSGLPARSKPQQFLKRPPPPGYALQSLNLVTEPRQDICKGHCNCERAKNAFVTVYCDFQSNRHLSQVFGKSFKVPHDATAIAIKLAPSTQFRLERGFFDNNTVNSLTIEGSLSEGEQVEITTDAFRGNNGPYPDINLTNVFAVIVRTKAFSGNCKFTVRNSNDLILYADAFENAMINGLFAGIKDLRIGEKAFNSAQARLRIESSHIDNIYRFEASLREIRFINCTIGTINAGTFDVININSIIFEGCRIDAIKARAITEKLYSKHVSITDASIGSIESEAIYGSGIAELILSQNRIDTIHENAIYVTSINATIARNNIKHLGNNWLRVKEWSNIVVERNQFGVFGRMLLEEARSPVICHFYGNSLTQPLPGSLNLTNPHCIIREVSVNIPCRCNLDWLHRLSSHDLRSETYCTIDDKLGTCFNATTFNTLKYLNEVCDESKTVLDCVANMNLKKIDGHFFTPEELDQRKQRVPELVLVLVGISLLLLLTTLLVAVVVCRFCRRPTKVGGDRATAAQPSHVHEFTPEERLVIDQTLQLIQKKYPEIYRSISGRTQQMLSKDLPDKSCVKVISQIINLLNKVESPGSDLVPFNRVLTQHLQPPAPTAPPADGGPIYSEPGLVADDNGFYVSNTFAFMEGAGAGVAALAAAAAAEAEATTPEHIYAEPNCAQQPLLRNEYASPADGHLAVLDLYTEPVNGRECGASAAYATIPAHPEPHQSQNRLPQYASPVRSQLPPAPAVFAGRSPSERHAQNLPDVLCQSSSVASHSQPNKSLSKVRQMAQDLQSRPAFNLKQSVAPHRLLGRRGEPDEFELDLRGATALPPDSGSDHSGGSHETVKIDDVIDYADA